MVAKLVVFAILSIPILYISRRSLLRPRSHGFYRFFAWELITALFLLNLEVWFQDAWAWHQLVSWFLLFTSLVPLYFGTRALTGRGKPQARRDGEPQLLAFEKTTVLVTSGIYRYIRHPLYSSLLFLTWGIFFKQPAWVGLGLAGAASLLLVATARADEAECRSYFGEAYAEYVKHTRRFVPFIF